MAQVMIVEDEFVIAKYLERLIAQMGHVSFGTFAREGVALDALSIGTPDVALLDVSLRHNETCANLVEALIERDVAVIFLSGSPPVSRATLRNYEHLPWLPKPVDKAALRRILGEVLA